MPFHRDGIAKTCMLKTIGTPTSISLPKGCRTKGTLWAITVFVHRSLPRAFMFRDSVDTFLPVDQEDVIHEMLGISRQCRIAIERGDDA